MRRAAGRGRLAVLGLMTLATGTLWLAQAQTAPAQAVPTQPTPTQTVSTPLTPSLAPAPANTATPDAADPALNQPTAHEQAGNCVEGTEQTCLSLARQSSDGKEHKILVIRTGTTDDTGIYTICSPRDNDPEGTPNIGVFSESGPGGIRIVIDKNVVRVPLAKVTQRPAQDGKDGSDGSIEASAGTARFLDTVPESATDRLTQCGVEFTPKPAPDTVFVTQGKTQLKGQKLAYDETDGIARIDGPITFSRDNADDPLSGKSDHIEVDVDREKTVLVGNVELTSQGGRISKADRVEYDDAANVARLYATAEHPAVSTKGSDRISISQGYIYYDLTTNGVVVWDSKGSLSGEFQDGESK